MNLKPSAMCLLGGGALLFIASFLKWAGNSFVSVNGLDTDVNGMLGIFTLLIGLAVAGITAATTFGEVKLPEQVLGFTIDQIVMKLGFAAFLITFGLQFRSSAAFGITLAWIASAAIVVGSVLKQRESVSA